MRKHTTHWIALSCLAATLLGCGGGEPTYGPSHPVPDLAVIFVSGHNEAMNREPSPSYLDTTAGPSLMADLRAAGYSAQERYFVDGADDIQGFGGYNSLLTHLETLRDRDVPFGTRVIVVAHGHGGVWANTALRQLSDLPITASISLDTSSLAWGITGHSKDNDLIGADPRNTTVIARLNTCPQSPQAPSEESYGYDTEDVVPNTVRYAFEVRSGDVDPRSEEAYDQKWNLFEDGSTQGLSCYYSNTSHSEVHQGDGTTMAAVKKWLLGRLAQH